MVKDNQLSVSGSRPNQLSDAARPDVLSDAGVDILSDVGADIFDLILGWIFVWRSEYCSSSMTGYFI